MSAVAAVRAGVRAAFIGDGALSAEINGVYDSRPPRATPPWIEIGEAQESEWGASAMRGRELRFTVVVRDEGTTPARLHKLTGLAQAAIEAMARDLDGWRIASLVLLRSRAGRRGDGIWASLIEYRVRVTATP